MEIEDKSKAQTFDDMKEGWVFCGQRILRIKWERCRVLAKTDAQKLVVRRMYDKYLEEAALVRKELIHEGRSTEQFDLVLQKNHPDHYSGPLLHGRWQVMESLMPTGTYYVADHVLPDLLVKAQGSMTETRRFNNLKAAHDYVEDRHGSAHDDAQPTQPRYVRGLPSNQRTTPMPKTKAAAPPASKTKTPAAPAASTNAPRGSGIGAMAREMIAKGMENQAIVDAIRAKVPSAATTVGNISWYRGQMKKAGETVPSTRAPAAPPAKAAAAAKTSAKAPTPPKKGGKASTEAVIAGAKKEALAGRKAAARTSRGH